MGYCILLLISQLIFGTGNPDPVTESVPELQDIGRIELIISNIRSSKGVVRIGMYTSEAGYPDTPANGFTATKDSLSGGKVRFIIPVKQPGNYGFSILDDENGNSKMDYILGIIPKEGFGFSNNPKVTRKAPTFSETSFRFEKGIRKVEISMVYM